MLIYSINKWIYTFLIIRYEVDETSPSQFGDEEDYEILSKKVKNTRSLMM